MVAMWNGRYFEVWHYRYLNRVPLRETQPALEVNWCEVSVTQEANGQQLYQNSWVTNHHLTSQRVIEVKEVPLTVCSMPSAAIACN